jgi:hypothetical protein
MSSSSDFELVHGQLHVTKDPAAPEPLGRGSASIHGASYMQGPAIVGSDKANLGISATLMVNPLKNSDSPTPAVIGSICGVTPTNPSLYVIGNTAIKASLFVSSNVLARGNIVSQSNVKSQCGKHILSKKKNFDIPHPSKEGWRLRYTCIEGPSNDVYIKGRVKNKTEIDLPSYWKDFVDIESIVVTLQPIGAHQDVIIKRWDENKVYLQAKGGMPIDCFYHIIAERIDGEKLIPEYQGETPADYPGDNSEYSISGYHYDVKEEV